MALPQAMPQKSMTRSPAGGDDDAAEGGRGAGKPLMEIVLCIYEGGKLAVAMGDGEKHDVPDLDTAIMAIRRLAETEMQEPGEVPPGEEEAPAEEGEEEAMVRGYGT